MSECPQRNEIPSHTIDTIMHYLEECVNASYQAFDYDNNDRLEELDGEINKTEGARQCLHALLSRFGADEFPQIHDAVCLRDEGAYWASWLVSYAQQMEDFDISDFIEERHYSM